jgi:hypothetical protein
MIEKENICPYCERTMPMIDITVSDINQSTAYHFKCRECSGGRFIPFDWEDAGQYLECYRDEIKEYDIYKDELHRQAIARLIELREKE